MGTVEQSVEVEVPVSVAYRQWTHVETFPAFMSGVEEVARTGEDMTHWVTSIDGVRREFDARITEDVPDERVAWTTVGAPHHSGLVTFVPTSERSTRVLVQMDLEPNGVVEGVADRLGLLAHRVGVDLDRFREYVEGREAPAGH